MNVGLPDNLAATGGGSSLNTNWAFLSNTQDVPDIFAGLAMWPNGYAGFTWDCRTTGQPTYTNGGSISQYIDNGGASGTQLDNTSLTAPNSPGIFIATKNTNFLNNFVRLFPGDIKDDFVGVFLQKWVTGEDCSNPGAYRWVLCSQLIT